MKICYIWVEKFRNFNNLGINLTNDLKFEYDSNSNIISQRNYNSLPTDFFGERITEVTGIIGKNGSGKSNALELICKVLKGGKTDIGCNSIIITEDNNKLTCYYYFKYTAPPEIDKSLKITLEEYSGKINPLKVVFFSNVFDDRRNGFNTDIADISVNNLYMKKFYLATNKRLSDFEKQIKFISSKQHFQTLDIAVPNKILISLKLWNGKFNQSSQRHMYGDENNKKIIEIRASLKTRLKELVDQNRIIQALKYGFFFDIYEKILRDYGRRGDFRNDLIKEFNDFIKHFSLNGSTDELTDNFISFIENKIHLLTSEHQFNLFEFYHEDEYSHGNNYKKPLILEQLEFIKNIKHLFSELNIKTANDSSRNRTAENFIVDYSKKRDVNIVNEFIRLFESSNFIDINWLGISSGHKAYLNLFSSIHDEIKNLRTQNLLICIDEGDLYLHPKWQIEFFNKLITVLPKIYFGNIQLILTSHSPFLLSDLPKQNITILDETFSNSTLDGVDLKLNTFGGNLYDLYSEPFFLGNKRTSDFAYSKIKNLIEKVESNEYTKSEKIELEKLLMIIGDEIIQYRLKNILGND